MGRILPNNVKLDILVEENGFNICNEQTYYFKPLNNKIYNFAAGEFKPVYEPGFGNYNILAVFLKKEQWLDLR